MEHLRYPWRGTSLVPETIGVLCGHGHRVPARTWAELESSLDDAGRLVDAASEEAGFCVLADRA
jgi:hypothetical protein